MQRWAAPDADQAGGGVCRGGRRRTQRQTMLGEKRRDAWGRGEGAAVLLPCGAAVKRAGSLS
jgi:hypothetical protein